MLNCDENAISIPDEMAVPVLPFSQIGQSIYAKLWLNPPQIATEAFSSDLLPERCPE